MKLANQIRIKVFSKPEDNREEILTKLKSLVPFSLEEEKVKLEQDTAIGFNDKEIKIYEITLTKDRHINAFIENLKKNLSDEQKILLLNQIESRLDQNLNFFLRLDKNKLLEDKYWVTDAGNCFHIKISIAAFPATRENAFETIKKLFS